VTIVVPLKASNVCAGAAWSSPTKAAGTGPREPNAPTPEEMNPGVPADILALGIEGPLATLAIEVLESSVNPAIASHGGAPT